MSPPRIRLLPLAVLTMISLGPAHAQQLPPIAAPTSDVSVSALPVVRSQSQQVGDFAAGLLQGLVATQHVPGLALIVVQNDHVMTQKSLGMTPGNDGVPVSGDSVFPVGQLSDLVVAIAAMQLVEKASLLPADDVGKVLGDPDYNGLTIDQLLTHRVKNATALLGRVVAKRADMAIDSVIATDIFGPLKMRRSRFENGHLLTTANDMGRLMLALLNGGTYDGGTILSPDTVALMQHTHFTVNPALPGWSYGLPEERRGGWLAFQHDGRTAETDARLVLVPEAKIGYFAVVAQNTGPVFWRVFDNSLFDRVLPPRARAAPSRSGPVPAPEEAHQVAGLYKTGGAPVGKAVFLKTSRQRLRVDGQGDGALVLSGALDGRFAPRAGGYWRSTETGVPAVYRAGRLYVGNTVFARWPFWQRPIFYGWLAIGFAVLAVAGAGLPWRLRLAVGLTPLRTRVVVPVLAGTALAFLVIAVVLRYLALAG